MTRAIAASCVQAVAVTGERASRHRFKSIDRPEVNDMHQKTVASRRLHLAGLLPHCVAIASALAAAKADERRMRRCVGLSKNKVVWDPWMAHALAAARIGQGRPRRPRVRIEPLSPPNEFSGLSTPHLAEMTASAESSAFIRTSSPDLGSESPSNRTGGGGYFCSCLAGYDDLVWSALWLKGAEHRARRRG